MKSAISQFAVILVSLTLVMAVSILTGATPRKAVLQEAGDGVRRITPAELREALKKETAVLIDVRNEEAYKAGHIKGARLIPLSEIDSRFDELPKTKLVATYCS